MGARERRMQNAELKVKPRGSGNAPQKKCGTHTAIFITWQCAAETAASQRHAHGVFTWTLEFAVCSLAGRVPGPDDLKQRSILVFDHSDVESTWQPDAALTLCRPRGLEENEQVWSAKSLVALCARPACSGAGQPAHGATLALLWRLRGAMAATGGSPGVPESLSTLLSTDEHALCLAEALHD
eukprot:5839152-Prymnesium_polylepis.1